MNLYLFRKVRERQEVMKTISTIPSGKVVDSDKCSHKGERIQKPERIVTDYNEYERKMRKKHNHKKKVFPM